MKTLNIIFGLLIIATTTFAADNINNKVKVSGKVIDQVTGEVLTGVSVQVEGTNHKTYSDFDGNFTFEGLKPGEYNITASYISYEKTNDKLVISTSNNTSLKLILKAAK
jgi:uncharacterized protein YvpB